MNLLQCIIGVFVVISKKDFHDFCVCCTGICFGHRMASNLEVRCGSGHCVLPKVWAQ